MIEIILWSFFYAIPIILFGGWIIMTAIFFFPRKPEPGCWWHNEPPSLGKLIFSMLVGLLWPIIFWEWIRGK